jgi:hypothetical protein
VREKSLITHTRLSLLLVIVALAGACSASSPPSQAGSRRAAAQSVAAAGSAGSSAGLAGAADIDPLAGTLLVDTTCGLAVSDACPNDPATDGQCGLEEAIQALSDHKSENGCVWSGTLGRNDTILVPDSQTFSVTTSLQISRAVTIRSATPGKLATIRASDGNDLFGVEPVLPIAITFQDLHLIGAGRDLETQSSGLSISGESPTEGVTINVTRCWIEQFSNGAIIASDVNLNVTDTTLDSNNNDYGDGGGGIFYGTNGDAKSQVYFLNINNSSITHNHSTKGGGLQIQSNSVTRITNSTISENITDGGHGGGISFANNAGPLADGILRIVGSTIAFNGSTTFDGGGIAIAANQELFTENIDNQLYLAGSIVSNNCLGSMSSDASFACSAPNDVAGDIYQLQDSLLGASAGSTLVGPERAGLGRDGITFLDVDAGLDPELSDPGGTLGHTPLVHQLNPDSIAIDATDVLKTVNASDQTHHDRGFDHLPLGSKRFDFGAVERRTNP